jgi:hypothetical protein
MHLWLFLFLLFSHLSALQWHAARKNVHTLFSADDDDDFFASSIAGMLKRNKQRNEYVQQCNGKVCTASTQIFSAEN